MAKKVGRPSSYSPELAAEICRRMAEANASLVVVCRDPDMPSRDTVYAWLREHPAFSDNYARATQDRRDLLCREILDIADDRSADTVKGEDGSQRIAHKHVQRSRLRVDTRKWMVGRMDPGPRDRSIQVKLPKVESAADTTKAMAAVVEAVSSGSITPAEGGQLAGMLEGMRRIIETEDIDRRLAALENGQ